MNEKNKQCFKPRPHLTKEQRLPKCYKDVEKVIRTVKSCQSNFKTVLANSRFRGQHFKKVYNLAFNVLKHYEYIQKIIQMTKLLEKEQMLHREITSVLIYEMIFGYGNLYGESKPVITIQRYKSDIMSAHQKLQYDDDIKVKELYIPHYAKVHTLVTTVSDVISNLKCQGYKEILYDDISEEKYLELVKNLQKGNFLVDFHFKDLLVFSYNENLIDLQIYQDGHIFLQDKSSYIPVHALNPEPGSTVLDACAAPGMKSVHMVAKMKNKGLLIACERDKQRFDSLKQMLEYGAVKISKLFCKDFKLMDPNDEAFSSIDYILVDPSCSGSGMVNRMDEVINTKDPKYKERLQKLAGFQVIVLKHALKFPSVKRVVYSTCSINEEENEYVVQEALSAFQHTFKLVPAMPEWSVKGLEQYECGKMCVRTIPEKHLTNGFFVAMFQRLEGNEKYEKFSRAYEKNKVYHKTPNYSHIEHAQNHEDNPSNSKKMKKKHLKAKISDPSVDVNASTKNLNSLELIQKCKKFQKSDLKDLFHSEPHIPEENNFASSKKKLKKTKFTLQTQLENTENNAAKLVNTVIQQNKEDNKAVFEVLETEIKDGGNNSLKELSEKVKNHKKRKHSENAISPNSLMTGKKLEKSSNTNVFSKNNSIYQIQEECVKSKKMKHDLSSILETTNIDKSSHSHNVVIKDDSYVDISGVSDSDLHNADRLLKVNTKTNKIHQLFGSPDENIAIEDNPKKHKKSKKHRKHFLGYMNDPRNNESEVNYEDISVNKIMVSVEDSPAKCRKQEKIIRESKKNTNKDDDGIQVLYENISKKSSKKHKKNSEDDISDNYTRERLSYENIPIECEIFQEIQQQNETECTKCKFHCFSSVPLEKHENFEINNHNTHKKAKKHKRHSQDFIDNSHEHGGVPVTDKKISVPCNIQKEKSVETISAKNSIPQIEENVLNGHSEKKHKKNKHKKHPKYCIEEEVLKEDSEIKLKYRKNKYKHLQDSFGYTQESENLVCLTDKKSSGVCDIQRNETSIMTVYENHIPSLEEPIFNMENEMKHNAERIRRIKSILKSL